MAQADDFLLAVRSLEGYRKELLGKFLEDEGSGRPSTWQDRRRLYSRSVVGQRRRSLVNEALGGEERDEVRVLAARGGPWLHAKHLPAGSYKMAGNTHVCTGFEGVEGSRTDLTHCLELPNLSRRNKENIKGRVTAWAASLGRYNVIQMIG